MALRIGVVKGEILIRINGSDELTKVGEIEIPIEAEVTPVRRGQYGQPSHGGVVTAVTVDRSAVTLPTPAEVARKLSRAHSTAAERAFGRSV